MLTARELDLLRRASRNTPAGNALRRHWLPVLPASRLPEPDGEPVSLRVLTEPLVLFRDSAGRIGVLDGYCPHEGGTLARGTNAKGGITCILHGWKFDVEGRRVDSGAVHGAPVRTASYPAVVHQGIVPQLSGTRPSGGSRFLFALPVGVGSWYRSERCIKLPASGQAGRTVSLIER